MGAESRKPIEPPESSGVSEPSAPPASSDSPESEESQERAVDALIERARTAQKAFEEKRDQALYDRAALAVAWAVMEPARNEELSALAVEHTGLGNVPDKIVKNRRKTLGLLRDISGVKTCGIIGREKGIVRIARPKGIVAAITPSTNPVATPANNAINALKCGNAVILSPSPKGAIVCERFLHYVRLEFAKCGIDPDLVQTVPAPSTKIKTARLMARADILVVTGSQDNVRRAYSSGTPALGVGAGNVSVIVDETADLTDAAEKITASKIFDNSTSCSCENALIVLDGVYDEFLEILARQGGHLLKGEQAEKLKKALFVDGSLNGALLAKDIATIAQKAGFEIPENARFALIEGGGIGPDHPESGEKLSPVAALYRARDFDHAKRTARALLDYVGAGHSVGLHSKDEDRALQLGLEMPACRIIVNQAHCFATGGAFDNALPFSLSMGCGSWGGNSLDDNFNYRHLMNITKIASPIEANEPSAENMFADYWRQVGK